MTDYTWPSIYFAYLLLRHLLRGGGVLLRPLVEGRLLEQDGEDIKYQVFDESEKRDGAQAVPEAQEHAHVAR